MGHSHGHAGHNHGEENLSDRQLIFAVAINVLLTVAQIIGGIVSGSFGLPWLLTVFAGLLLAAAVRALLLHQAAHTTRHFKSLLAFLVGFALLALIFAGLAELSDVVNISNSGLEHPVESAAATFSK